MIQKIIRIILLSLLIFLLIYYKDTLVNNLNIIFDNKVKIVESENNYYKLNYNFELVHQVDNFVPKSKEDLINIYFSVLNSGFNSITFYCPNEYPTCIEDIKELSKNDDVINTLNNYIHPYNSYNKIHTNILNNKKITIDVEKLYSKEDIDVINQKVIDILKSITNDSMSDVDKIRTIHNYIIENTIYDTDKLLENPVYNYKSNIAYGPLLQGFGICGGYSDAMSLFLNQLGIPNYRIASEDHIWNLVYINNEWLHLDLTWDDPIMSDGSNIVDDKFFLINTNELLEIEPLQHNYEFNLYLEAKKK